MSKFRLLNLRTFDVKFIKNLYDNVYFDVYEENIIEGHNGIKVYYTTPFKIINKKASEFFDDFIVQEYGGNCWNEIMPNKY